MKLAQRKLARRMKFRGLDVSIETDKGQLRHWYDPHADEKGSTKMEYPYGYIRRTEGTDGDHVDVYVGPYEDAKNVYIIDQKKKPQKDGTRKWRRFDEQKCMLGFRSAEEAKTAYLNHYNDDRFFGSMTTMPFEDFKQKVLGTFKNPQKIAMSIFYKLGQTAALEKLALVPAAGGSRRQVMTLLEELLGSARGHGGRIRGIARDALRQGHITPDDLLKLKQTTHGDTAKLWKELAPEFDPAAQRLQEHIRQPLQSRPATPFRQQAPGAADAIAAEEAAAARQAAQADRILANEKRMIAKRTALTERQAPQEVVMQRLKEQHGIPSRGIPTSGAAEAAAPAAAPATPRQFGAAHALASLGIGAGAGLGGYALHQHQKAQELANQPWYTKHLGIGG